MTATRGLAPPCRPGEAVYMDDIVHYLVESNRLDLRHNECVAEHIAS